MRTIYSTILARVALGALATASAAPVPGALLAAVLLWQALPSGTPVRQIGSPLQTLFAPRLKAGTLLFWLIFSIGLGLFYAIQAWLPLLSMREGQSYGSGVAATSLFTLGTAFGAVPAIW
ncbi:hypothetical protein DM806_14170 [Sphingobium lactosutens]|uniref:hypothetical protein n=1 Tax=Sphingobium lactosutens TaxID=522773 RepID=UPI0015B9063E|nr:hypothetical protein [Sphingobium lactosutens]NWK96787.1 hypothetical protein [Sphingobium lactosutens]